MLLLFVVLMVLPLSWGLGQVQSSDITYYMHVKNHQKPFKVERGDSVVPGTRIILMIHGAVGHRRVDWYTELKDALLAKPKTHYNVIEVFWSRIASLEYSKVAGLVEDVGNTIGDFVLSMGVSPENVHLVGHSLGAHVASFAGKYIKAKSHRKIWRITGLDPAGPSFISRPVEKRINKEDAQVVVIIHTDMVLGFPISCGFVDFWPNGGHDQPGCEQKECFGPNCYCSQHRAYLLYIDALRRPGTLIGRDIVRRTNKALDMGGIITDNTTLRGDYYLATNSEVPYGLEQRIATPLLFKQRIYI